jgi:hypothetical protein
MEIQLSVFFNRSKSLSVKISKHPIRHGLTQERETLREVVGLLEHTSKLVSNGRYSNENSRMFVAIANGSPAILGCLAVLTGESGALQNLLSHSSTVISDSAMQAISRFGSSTDITRLSNHFQNTEVPLEYRSEAVLNERATLLSFLSELAQKSDTPETTLSAIAAFGLEGLVALKQLAQRAPPASPLATKVLERLCVCARQNVNGDLINKGESFQNAYNERAVALTHALGVFVGGERADNGRRAATAAIKEFWAARKQLFDERKRLLDARVVRGS